MKSIKEKSEEYAPYTREDTWNKIQKCMLSQLSFEIGANYVLDEVECILADKELDCEEICNELVAWIEQLKK